MRTLLISIPLLMLMSCNDNTKNISTDDNSKDRNTTTPPDMHTSEIALDWEGRYNGVLPCANCEGIETTINLNADKTFLIREAYLGKGEDPMEETGSFDWTEDGGSVELETVLGGKRTYKVGENVLIARDTEGNEIKGEIAETYRLEKAFADQEIENVTWELVEMDGGKINYGKEDTPAYFILTSSEGRVSGNLGCNNFFGTYELQHGMRIEFSPLGATMMACPNMSTETRLNEVLQTVDNYTIADGVLSLNKARMAPLAVFKAVKK